MVSAMEQLFQVGGKLRKPNIPKSKSLATDIEQLKKQIYAAREGVELAFFRQQDLHKRDMAECCQLIKKKSNVNKQYVSLMEELNSLKLVLADDTIIADLDEQLRSLELKGRIEKKENREQDPHNEYPIAFMGDYIVNMQKKKPLRNPRLSDMENQRESEAFFGNPFKRTQERSVNSEAALESRSNNQSVSPFLPTITISEDLKVEIMEEVPEKKKETPKEESIKKSEDTLVVKFVKECFNSKHGDNKISITTKVTAEQIGLQKVVLHAKQYSKQIFELIRKGNRRSEDELFSLIKTILDSSEISSSHFSFGKRKFISKILQHIRSYNASSPLIKRLKELRKGYKVMV